MYNFGAVIGDNTKAVDVDIKSGSKIWPNLDVTGVISGDRIE